MIQTISALGYILPLFIILAAQYHQVAWHEECDLSPTWRIYPTETGWTNNDAGLAFIKHFDQHTASKTKGQYRLLVLNGHESHHSVEFELYCKSHNIITLCMPAHSSYKLKPLDISCFGLLKTAYSW